MATALPSPPLINLLKEEFVMAYNKETGMYEGFIYKITNNINGHFYIGQTRTTVKERFYDHTKDYSVSRYQKYGLYKAFKKYGVDNFSVSTIETHQTAMLEELNKILNEREKSLIMENRELYGKSFLYNHSQGGDYDGCTTENIPVIQYDYTGKEINRFNSIIDAKRITGTSGISSVINKKPQNLSANGYIWRRQDDPLTDEEIRFIRIRFNTIPIKQYGYNYILIRQYDSINDAAKSIANDGYNIDTVTSHIKICCEHKSKTSYGYIWRYEFDDSFDNVDYKNCQFAIEQRENGTGKLLNTFISTGEASRITGVNDSTISQCCNHNLDLAGGYLWNRVGDYNPEILKTVTIKPVVQLSKQGEYIATYDSPTYAQDITGIYSKSISRVCRGFLKSTGGYYWQYLYDYLKILS